MVSPRGAAPRMCAQERRFVTASAARARVEKLRKEAPERSRPVLALTTSRLRVLARGEKREAIELCRPYGARTVFFPTPGSRPGLPSCRASGAVLRVRCIMYRLKFLSEGVRARTDEQKKGAGFKKRRLHVVDADNRGFV